MRPKFIVARQHLESEAWQFWSGRRWSASAQDARRYRQSDRAWHVVSTVDPNVVLSVDEWLYGVVSK